MTASVRLLAVLAAASVVLVGCATTDDTSAQSPDATTKAESDAGAVATPTAAENQSAAVPLPGRGTCWAVPADAVDDPAYWYDGSPTVACSEPHTTQTAWVFPLEEPTIAAAEEKGFDCWDKVRLFLSVNPVYWVPWGVFMALPSEQEVADGASWVRCDAIFPESWDFETVRTVRGSVEGVAVDPPEEFWACLDDDPQLPEQPFVPCDQPHQYEQTGTLVILDGLAGVADYPDRDERDAAALDQCRTAVRDEAGDDLAVTAVWDDPRVLEVLPEIAGVCFMYNANGDPLAPRP